MNGLQVDEVAQMRERWIMRESPYDQIVFRHKGHRIGELPVGKVAAGEQVKGLGAAATEIGFRVEETMDTLIRHFVSQRDVITSGQRGFNLALRFEVCFQLGI